MPAEPVELLSQTRPFSLLPLPVLEETASKLSLMTFSRGTVLALQGRTTLDYVYLIRSGSLELFFESNGRKTLQGTLDPGDIFGAISILMNAGLSIRSLAVTEDAALYLMPKKAFLDLCDRHAFILDHFNRAFSQRMQNESYAAAIAGAQTAHFLARIPPFSFLPEEDLRSLAPHTSSVFFPAFNFTVAVSLSGCTSRHFNASCTTSPFTQIRSASSLPVSSLTVFGLLQSIVRIAYAAQFSFRSPGSSLRRLITIRPD